VVLRSWASGDEQDELANTPVTASDQLSPTATYHIPGTSALAGTFAGSGEVLRNIRRLFRL